MLQIEPYCSCSNDGCPVIITSSLGFSEVLFVKTIGFLLIFAAVAAASPIYTVVDLGGLGGPAAGYAINSSGTVAGWAQNPSGYQQAVCLHTEWFTNAGFGEYRLVRLRDQ